MELTTDISTWRVLIVDDEPDNSSLASDLLDFCGAKTAIAGDGMEGLEKIASFAPNLILLDLGMPRMDGWEMFQRIRARSELNGIPVIALTALAMPQDAEKVHAAGFDAYITKPFRIQALLQEITACVQAFLLKATHPSEVVTKEP